MADQGLEPIFSVDGSGGWLTDDGFQLHIYKARLTGRLIADVYQLTAMIASSSFVEKRAAMSWAEQIVRVRRGGRA